jgi:uncharacterized protein YegL
MTDVEQVPFEGLGFAENPEPRCACVLVLDKSGSMSGAKIQQLNAGVRFFRDELLSDELATKRVELAAISFGPLTVDSEFSAPDMFSPADLVATGDTPMGAATLKAIEMVKQRKAVYRQNGVSFYRPWIILITDGAPTDDISAAAALVREGEAGKNFAFFAIGVDSADMTRLAQLSSREPLHMQGLKFKELFLWLSSSMKTVSHSSPDAAKLALPPPTGWAEL